jgi:MFS family permease
MLHGMFSIGSAVGAGTAAIAAAFGVPLVVHLSLVALLLAVSLAVAGMYLLPDRAGSEQGAPSFALPSGAIWWLGIIAICALLSEGAVGDWSAIFLRDAFDAGAKVAALGFGAFALTMTAGRFAGDRVVDRYGAVPILRISGALTAGGIGLSLAAPGPALAIIGFALAGVGISVVFPIVVRAASRSREMAPGAAIAAVSTTGYTGFLAGPPAIGLLSEAAGLRWGLAVLVVLGLATVILAAHGRAADRDR